MQHWFADGGLYTANAYGMAMAVVAVLSLGVGIWVVVRERASRISLSLMAGSSALAIYLFGFSFMVQAVDAGAAHRWSHVAYLGIPLIVPALYHFSIDLLGFWERRKAWIVAAWVVGFVYLALVQATDVLVPGVMATDWGYYTELTVWNAPFVLWTAFLLAFVIHDYWAAYRRADPVQQARIRWLAIPILAGSLGLVDYLPSLGLEIPPVGFVALALFPLAAAWVVARYHLPELTPAFAANQILATMAEPLLLVDDLDRVAFSNAAACRLLGWSQAEIEGRSLAALFGAAAAGRLGGRATLQGEEMEIEGRTGEPITVAVSTNPLVVRGRVVGTVIVARDIRERIRVARELERREQYFRALIENARDTITVLDADGRVRYQSPSHREVLGREPGEDVGRSVFQEVHPDDVETVKARFARLVQNRDATDRVEVRMRHSDGSYRTLDVRAQNLLHNPAVQGIVVNGRDITQERRLQKQLQHTEKLETVGRLAGGIAHDFNNILTTIQGNVSLMEEEVSDGSELAEELKQIGRGAERAAHLTARLLQFGRRQMTQPELLDPNELVTELRPVLERTVDPATQVEIETTPTPGCVRVDRNQFRKALIDLAQNAADAMEAGRLRVATETVEIGPDRAREMDVAPGSYVRLVVADTGRGMDDATRQRAFEPFFTTKEDDLDAGLGLATVYGAVRQARGQVELESRPGEGTRVSIYLPRVDVGAERDGAAVPSPREAAEPGGNEVILVVEDEAPVRGLVTKVLEREGFTVLSAEDGERALEVAGEHTGPIDLLIADLVMPGISGREVAERLGAKDPSMGIILISGYTTDEVVRDGIERGDYAFIPKPFTPATLTQRVADVLQGRHPVG